MVQYLQTSYQVLIIHRQPPFDEWNESKTKNKILNNLIHTVEEEKFKKMFGTPKKWKKTIG